MAKLLIVEDDRKINELMVRTLSMNGHQCLPVFTGKEALLAARGQSIDLVLLGETNPSGKLKETFYKTRNGCSAHALGEFPGGSNCKD